MSKLKVCILLHGNYRTFDKCNFEHFLNQDADIFIVTSLKKFNYHPFIVTKYDYTKINDITITEEELVSHMKKFDYINLEIENDTPINKQNISPKMRDFDSIIYQYTKIKNTLERIEKFEMENDFRYDIIINTRFDLRYNIELSELIKNFEKNTFIWDSWVGNDIFFMSDGMNFKKIINSFLRQFENQTYEFANIDPPHKLLAWCVNQECINEKKYVISEVIRY